MNICGPQYTGKGCECRPQVTPGITVATGEASNPSWICAHVENGIQIGCDPGCCTTDCSGRAAGGTAADGAGAAVTPKRLWWVILISILFGLMLFVSYFYKSTKRSNSNPYGVIGFTAAAIITIIVTAAVMLTKK